MQKEHRYSQKSFFAFTLILISAFSVILYLNSTHGKFVYDDFKIIVDNVFIKEWRFFPKIFTQEYFQISGELSYRPVVTISYFIDYAIWQQNPFGYHLTNILLHTLNTVLFYLFLRSVIRNKKILLLSTFFFVTHPILIETVNSIGYREDLLATTFLLISLIYFLKSDMILYGESRRKKHFIPYYAISLVAYLGALFSKEMALAFPAILFLFVIFSDKKIVPEWLKRFKGIYLGYIAISLFYFIIRFKIFNNPSVDIQYKEGGLWVNFFTMVTVLASYIKLSFFPFHLNADYVVPLVASPLKSSWILSAVFLISIFIIFAVLCKLRHMFAFWMAWFFILVVPVMNIVPVANIMAERYLYLPVMGFCVVKGILVFRITDTTLSSHALPMRRVVQLCLIIFILSSSGFSIIWKNGTWRDERTLWGKTIEHSPRSSRAHCNLGNIYKENGMLEAAHIEYKKALQFDPKNARIHSNLGTVYNKKGLTEKAFAEYKKAIELDKYYAQPHNNLGNIYLNQKQLDHAQHEYEEALRLKPDYSHAHNGLGSVFDARGQLDKAMEEFKKALYYENTYIHAINNLGVNYAKRGQMDKAIAEFLKASEVNRNQPISYYNLGYAYEKLKKYQEAIKAYREAISVAPANLASYFALGNLYQHLHETGKAIEVFQKIIFISPDTVDAYKRLIFIYFHEENNVEKAREYAEMLLRLDPSQAQKEDMKQVLQYLNLSQG